MKYSLTHYLRHFPLRYYLSGGLVATSEPMGVFFLSQKNSSVLISKGQRVIAFEEGIGDLTDAPPVPGRLDPAAVGVRTFTSKLLSRNHSRGKAQLVLLPDCDVNDIYFNVHLVPNLREPTAEGLLESLGEEPRQVIGAWDETRSFRWAVLDANLRALSGRLDNRHAQIVILGLPADYCDDCESWAERQGASLMAIVPIPVACLGWFLKKVPVQQKTAFVLLQLTASVAIAVIQGRKLVLFRQYEEDIDHVRQELVKLTKQLSPEKEPYVCVWSWLVEEKDQIVVDGLALAGPVLQEIEGGQIIIQRRRGPADQISSPIALLLRWVAQEFR
ncbi:MAG: hypothetical protein JO271_00695 [Verrucomicrobia bacterium]|nr:hypothetical protein [Verrucomicrobiota bacterium]